MSSNPSGGIDTSNWTKEQKKTYWDTWLSQRNQARTDLLWLCRNVLDYKDVDDDVHGPLAAFLHPQFKGRFETVDMLYGGINLSRPNVNMYEQKGPRYQLILDPRGHLKTSVITIAKSIQWILNYPNIRILISTAVSDQAQHMLRELKSHFQFGSGMRFLFPEYCPLERKAADFGSATEFTVPCRYKYTKEPTVSVSSVGKVIAGYHYDVIQNSDLVDKENVKTSNQIREVNEHFFYLNPLLERSEYGHGWITVEGTRYAFADLYGEIQKKEKEKEPHLREWAFFIRSAEVDRDKKIALWPKRWGWDELKKMESESGPYIYSAQMLNHPVPDTGGLATRNQIVFLDRQIIKQLLPNLRLHTTVDLAGMETTSKGDYTVLCVAGFDRDGRIYIIDIQRGHFSPSEVIDRIFDIHATYPKMIDIKIEREAHSRVLLPFLRREMSKRQKFPNIASIKRDNSTSKNQRIKGLQPWFADTPPIIRFNESIECKPSIIDEILEFPSGRHDDILDTIADQMQNRDGDGGISYDMIPGGPRQDMSAMWPQDKFLGFDPNTKMESWVMDDKSLGSNTSMIGSL